MEPLKLCPFCNGSPSRVEGFRNSHCVSFIQCTICEAQGEKFEDKFPDIAKEKSIEAWNTRASEWVSVKDRLPENHERYLVIFDNLEPYYAVGFSSFIPATKEFNHTNITHWMPLPTPPKDSE